MIKMIVKTRRATILLCSVATVVLATSAIARPVHHHRQRVAATTEVVAQPQAGGAQADARYSSAAVRTAGPASEGVVVTSRRHGRTISIAEARAQAQSHSNPAYSGENRETLGPAARKYLGT